MNIHSAHRPETPLFGRQAASPDIEASPERSTQPQSPWVARLEFALWVLTWLTWTTGLYGLIGRVWRRDESFILSSDVIILAFLLGGFLLAISFITSIALRFLEFQFTRRQNFSIFLIAMMIAWASLILKATDILRELRIL